MSGPATGGTASPTPGGTASPTPGGTASPTPGGTVRGVGIDAVDVARLRRAIERRPRLADRVFTDAERAYAAAAADPGPRLAARFAAKEAVAKALGVGIGAVSWRDVEVVRDDLGAPSVVLAGEAAAVAARHGVARWHLSLTHTDTLAVASVVAEGNASCGEDAREGRP